VAVRSTVGARNRQLVVSTNAIDPGIDFGRIDQPAGGHVGTRLKNICPIEQGNIASVVEDRDAAGSRPRRRVPDEVPFRNDIIDLTNGKMTSNLLFIFARRFPSGNTIGIVVRRSIVRASKSTTVQPPSSLKKLPNAKTTPRAGYGPGSRNVSASRRVTGRRGLLTAAYEIVTAFWSLCATMTGRRSCLADVIGANITKAGKSKHKTFDIMPP